MEEMFTNCSGLKNISLYNITFSELITMKKMFEFSLIENAEFINIYFPKLISMEDMFNHSSIYNIYCKIYAPNLKSTEGMFYYCQSLTNFKLEGIIENVNNSRIETMENMFSYTNLRNFSMENINFLELTNIENFIFSSLS